MFEVEDLPPVAAMAGADEAGLIDAMAAAARFEAATMARRLAAIAELYCRRIATVAADDQFQWQVDNWDALTAEVGVAQGISRGRAGGLLEVALALRDRLPKVAAVFAQGRLDYRVVQAIVKRTPNVLAEDLDEIDTALAQRAHLWTKLSDAKVSDWIDYWVRNVDLVAERPKRRRDHDRHVGIGPDRDGMAELWGALRVTDAIALDSRLNQLAGTVCRSDPRTTEQRRADATGALAANQTRLACLCGQDDCPAAGDLEPGNPVAINVVGEQATISGDSDRPGYVVGYGVIDADTVRDLAKSAKVRPVLHPGESRSEKSYRPSRALADFIRCRDLSCRFPNCDVPAQLCQIDHTVPWPWGSTHASNLKLLCTHHHLLKTFFIGANGWGDKQLPDGTVVWIDPTGHTYTTKPHGTLFFPVLGKPTQKLVLPRDLPPLSPVRGLKMPTRTRTRAQSHRDRIVYERGVNYDRLFSDPPPF